MDRGFSALDIAERVGHEAISITYKLSLIHIFVDRLSIREGIEKRLTDSIENALKLGNGLMNLDVIGGETITFSQNFACTDCGISIDEIQPRSFSFNNPFGACPDCYGLGYKMEFDVDLMIPNQSLSICLLYTSRCV